MSRAQGREASQGWDTPATISRVEEPGREKILGPGKGCSFGGESTCLGWLVLGVNLTRLRNAEREGKTFFLDMSMMAFPGEFSSGWASSLEDLETLEGLKRTKK